MRPRKGQPAAAKLARVEELNERAQLEWDAFMHTREELLVAIREAHAAGFSDAMIARAAGLSRQRITQLRAELERASEPAE